MNKALKLFFIVNFTVYFSFYFIGAFIMWELTNPFQWVINLPTASSEDRFGTLMLIFLYYLFTGGLTLAVISSKNPSILDDDHPTNIARSNTVSPYHSTETVIINSGPDAVDIALGVGAGVLGADIVGGILGLDD